MGEAARKIAHTAAPARPALRLVAAPTRRLRPRRRGVCATHVIVMCALIIGLGGFGRVALAAQAAEAAVDSWGLREALRSERQAARSLEADRSSLAAPSRIEALASEMLAMDRPAQVCYLELPADYVEVPEAGPPTMQQTPDEAFPDQASGALVATLLDLAADEAQALLVGDMGLGEAW